MPKTFTFALALAAQLSLASPAGAGPKITVQNPDAVDFGVVNGKVYFRNLDQVDTTWPGCCYNYWFDLFTDTGRAQFSTFLTYKGLSKPFQLYKDQWATAGEISMIGQFQ